MKEPSRHRLKFFIVVAALVAATLGYMYWKRDVSSRENPQAATPDTRLDNQDMGRKVTSSTKERPGSPRQSNGRASEESRQFMLSQTCAFSLRSKTRMEHELKLCDLPEEVRQDPEQTTMVNFCLKRERDFRPALKRLDSALSRCPDLAKAEEAFYQSTLAAAQAGDADAQLCYVRSEFNLKRPWSGEDHTLYSQLAPIYIQQGFERGDWRFVELLRSATSAVANWNSLIFQVTTGDEDYRYRMHRLLRRGAQGKYADFLKYSEKVPEFNTADQVEESNIWADEMFARYFTQSPKASVIPNACNVDPIAYSPGEK